MLPRCQILSDEAGLSELLLEFLQIFGFALERGVRG